MQRYEPFSAVWLGPGSLRRVCLVTLFKPWLGPRSVRRVCQVQYSALDLTAGCCSLWMLVVSCRRVLLGGWVAYVDALQHCCLLCGILLALVVRTRAGRRVIVMSVFHLLIEQPVLLVSRSVIVRLHVYVKVGACVVHHMHAHVSMTSIASFYTNRSLFSTLQFLMFWIFLCGESGGCCCIEMNYQGTASKRIITSSRSRLFTA